MMKTIKLIFIIIGYAILSFIIVGTCYGCVYNICADLTHTRDIIISYRSGDIDTIYTGHTICGEGIFLWYDNRTVPYSSIEYFETGEIDGK